MDNKYDVIIIGAGPSGIFCAYELKRQNPRLKVLMIEKGSGQPMSAPAVSPAPSQQGLRGRELFQTESFPCHRMWEARSPKSLAMKRRKS